MILCHKPTNSIEQRLKDDLKQYEQLTTIAAASCGEDDQLTRNILMAIKLIQLKGAAERTHDNIVKNDYDNHAVAFNRTSQDELPRSQRVRRETNVSNYNDNDDGELVDLDDLDGDDQETQVGAAERANSGLDGKPTGANEPSANDWLYDYLMGQSKLEKTQTATSTAPPKQQQQQQCSCPPGKHFSQVMLSK